MTEVKIYYDGYKVESDLDKALEECLTKFGLKRFASGCNRTTGERDLAFDKGEKDDGSTSY